MTFLSLYFPALVFREQPGLWGGKGPEYLFMAVQKAGPKKGKRKGSPLSLLGTDGAARTTILPGLRQALGGRAAGRTLTAVTQPSHTGTWERPGEPLRVHECASWRTGPALRGHRLEGSMGVDEDGKGL